MGVVGMLRAFWQRNAAPAGAVPHVGLVGGQAGMVRSGVPSEALLLSKAMEGLSLVPYDDNGAAPGGTWTIGYGSTRDADKRPVTRDTHPITEAQALALAVRDMDRAARLVAMDFPGGLPPRWWAVGVLMCNNMGRMSSWGPTLLLLLREGQWAMAAAQMRHYRNASGQPSLGLRRRRWAEAAFALGMEPGEAKRQAWATINTADDWPALPG